MLSNNQSIETMLLNVLKSMNLQKNVLQNIHVSELSRINEAECNYKVKVRLFDAKRAIVQLYQCENNEACWSGTKDSTRNHMKHVGLVQRISL
jgi:hypothetical protein